MTRYSAEDAADRAGVDVDYFRQLVTLKILAPDDDGTFSEGDARRAASVHAMTDSGISLETFARFAADVASARMNLEFLDNPVYERFASVSRETFRSVHERTGIPLELLATIRESLGAPSPGPEDRMRDQELQVVPFLETTLREGSTQASLERMLRVMGDSLARVAEAEADWYYREVLQPQQEREQTTGRQEPDDSEQLSASIDQALLAIYHGQQGRTWMNNIRRNAGFQMADAGFIEAAERHPAICFLDITGYTRLTQERGDDAAASLAEVLGRLAQRTSAQHGGRPIKWLGDGVMFFFDRPDRGVVAAVEMVEVVAASGLPPAHVGISCGPVTFQQGDYFGQTVILASRIAEFARPGEVLVSQEVVDASSDSSVEFHEIGPIELKGVSGAVRLFSARLAASA